MKMFRLSSKIILAFTIIILTGTILMVSIINYTTRAGYETFVKDNDKKIAHEMISIFSDFYSLNRSWSGIEKVLVTPKPKMVQTMEGYKRRVASVPHIILTDENNNILLNTKIVKNNNRVKFSDNGIPITFDNKTVGYLYVGSMVEKSLTAEEETFLKKINTIIILVSLFILSISIIFTFIFSKEITKPISKLSKAATDIENGDYKIRVKSNGHDEISNLTNSFNRMAESIDSNDTWRKQIIADSAHELRTPVTLIQGNLEMILDGIYKPNKENLEGIYNETLILSRLVKELQELSSAESGTMELSIKDINIINLIESSLEIFKPEELKKSIKLTSNFNIKETLLLGDFQKLKQVLTNVLANAFRHTPIGGYIKVDITEDKSHLFIEIKDSGPGIPEDELEKVFERFYKVDSSRNRVDGGSGLGLSISREIIKLHNGTINSIKTDKNGAKFLITLPKKS